MHTDTFASNEVRLYDDLISLQHTARRIEMSKARRAKTLRENILFMPFL